MDNDSIGIVLGRIREEYPKYRMPIVTELVQTGKDPYKVLISCLLSLRTKDEVTAQAQERLFKFADDPEKMMPALAVEILPAWFGGEQIGLIRYLAVAEDQRGKGIGDEMAVFVIDWSGSKYERLLVLKPLCGERIVRWQIDRRFRLRIG